MGPKTKRIDLILAGLITAAITGYAINVYGLPGILTLCGVLMAQQIWFRRKYGYWQK